MIKSSVIPVIIIVFSAVISFAQPKIEVTGGTNRDFGDAYHGTKAEQVVTIRNVGADTLKISDVKAACGCTAALLSNSNIAPGDSGKLSIAFNTSGYNGKATKQVYLTTNDTSQTKTTINFSVNVLNILTMEPKFFSFDNSKIDSTYTKTITISNPSKEPIKILSVNSTLDQLKVELMKKQLMPGEQTQLQATYHPITSGTFQKEIEIVTDNKIQPKFQVRVIAWVNRK